MFGAKHGIGSGGERPRGVVGIVAHSGLHRAAERGELRDPVEHAALPRRMEARSGAREPAVPREPRAGRVPSLRRLAAPRSDGRSLVVLLHPDRPPVSFLSLRKLQTVRPLCGAPAVLRGAQIRRALRRSLVRGRARVPQPHLPSFQPAQRAALPHVRRALHAPVRRLLHRGFSVSTLPSRPSGSP